MTDLKVTDQLREEHESILAMLRVLETICERLQEGLATDVRHLDSMLLFFRSFADKLHHGKEEDLLFPAMEEAGIPREGGPIGVMLQEHEEGRAAIRGMTEAAERYGAGDSEAGLRFARLGDDYLTLLTQHIEKENNVLFVIADQHLTPAQQEQLSEAFARVDAEILTPSEREGLRRTLDRLRKTVLSE